MRGSRTARLFALTMVLGAIGALAWAGPAAAAAPIAGKVTNQSAAPLEGIEVCAVVLAPYRETCASTDAAGEYSIPSTGPGYKVHFYDPDNKAPSRAPQWYPGKTRPAEGEVVTEAEIAGGIDAVMTPGAEVRGTVVSRLEGPPISGVKVCFDPTTIALGEVPLCDETGADGRFVLSDLSAGTHTIVFEPGEGINYQPESFSTPLLSAGSAIETEVKLKGGVEFTGHLTDGTTGRPVEPFGGPGRTPMVCALESFSEARVKCVPVGAGGEYAIAGLPTGAYVVSFGEDTKEEGEDLHPDGYVRQYYDDSSTFEKATVEIVEAPNVLTGIDATLVRGEEIWPGEKDETPWELISEESKGGASSGGGSNQSQQPPPGAGVTPMPPGPLGLTPPPQRTVLPNATCRKGFHRVAKGGSARCVKIKPKKHHPTKHHEKKAGR